MKTIFIQRFFDAGAAGAAATVNPLGLALAGGQAALGVIQTISANAKINRLLGQRRAYQTPEEIYKILQATQQAMGGYDSTTLNFLTNQTDRAFDQATGAAVRLGGNPNDLSALFDRKIQSVMKIGADNHAINMEQFGKYLSALDTVAANKAAEQKSQQDIIKDKIQAASADKAAGIQNIGSAANAFIGLDASAKTSNLYTMIEKLLKGKTGATGFGMPPYNADMVAADEMVGIH